MNQHQINGEEDFNKLMEIVDKKLQDDGTPIPARELLSLREVSLLTGRKLICSNLSGEPEKDNYDDINLPLHIFKWVTERYGDRLKVDGSIGYMSILIRNDPWLLRLPRNYGSVKIIADPDLLKPYPNIAINRPGQKPQEAYLNVLTTIENFAPGLAKSLNSDEIMRILNLYLLGDEFFNLMRKYSSTSELVASARNDFVLAAKSAVSHANQSGQSLWHSLQGAEKLLKHYIQTKGEKFKYVHDLTDLVQQCYDLGMPAIDDGLISNVQCSPKVRYENYVYSSIKVVSANISSLKIGLHTFNNIEE